MAALEGMSRVYCYLLVLPRCSSACVMNSSCRSQRVKPLVIAWPCTHLLAGGRDAQGALCMELSFNKKSKLPRLTWLVVQAQGAQEQHLTSSRQLEHRCGHLVSELAAAVERERHLKQQLDEVSRVLSDHYSMPVAVHSMCSFQLISSGTVGWHAGDRQGVLQHELHGQLLQGPSSLHLLCRVPWYPSLSIWGI